MASDVPGVIGRGIKINGRLYGEEALLIEGEVSGTITLQNHLSIEESGVVSADIEAKTLAINGEVSGNIEAIECVSMHSGAKVSGDIKAPRVIIEDGAYFSGSVDMEVELPEDI